MSIVIRPAVEADQTAIVELVRLGELPPYSLKWQHFLVAEIEGKIVGVGQIRKHGTCNELGSLAVHPDYRGQGIAGKLVAALEDRAGLPLYLFCRDHLEGFYGRFGYRRLRFSQVPGPLRLLAVFAFTLP